MPEMAWWSLLAVCGVIAVRWWWGHVEVNRALRSALTVAPAPTRRSGEATSGIQAAPDADAPLAGGPAGPVPRVSVIIAAHDEAEAIGPCLRSILAQDYPDYEVIVANDRSTDATGRIVRDTAGRHPNLRCIDIDALPGGWLGKTHAVALAAREARGDYLVFTDSDVEWYPATLTTAMKFVQRRGLDFVSLWPKVVGASGWERFLLPACAWALGLWFRGGPPERPDLTPAYANGAFLLVRRVAYERIGGHAAVPDSMAEDVALARRARAAGLRRFLGLGVNLIRTRMYADLGQVVHGWTRIFIGALGARWKLAGTIVAAFFGCLAPFIITAVLLGTALAGGAFGPAQWAWLAVAVVHLAGMYTVMARHVAMVFEDGTRVALFPLAVLVVVGLLVRCLALSLGLGTIRWGNLRYRVQGSRAVACERSSL